MMLGPLVIGLSCLAGQPFSANSQAVEPQASQEASSWQPGQPAKLRETPGAADALDGRRGRVLAGNVFTGSKSTLTDSLCTVKIDGKFFPCSTTSSLLAPTTRRWNTMPVATTTRLPASCSTYRCPLGMKQRPYAGDQLCRDPQACSSMDNDKCCTPTWTARPSSSPSTTSWSPPLPAAYTTTPLLTCAGFQCPITTGPRPMPESIACRRDTLIKVLTGVQCDIKTCCFPGSSTITTTPFTTVTTTPIATITTTPLATYTTTPVPQLCTACPCLPGWILKPNSYTISCRGPQCTSQDTQRCCSQVTTSTTTPLPQLCSTFICPNGGVLRPNPWTIPCSGGSCSPGECCLPPATTQTTTPHIFETTTSTPVALPSTCASYACPSSMASIPNPSLMSCPNRQCISQICCWLVTTTPTTTPFATPWSTLSSTTGMPIWGKTVIAVGSVAAAGGIIGGIVGGLTLGASTTTAGASWLTPPDLTATIKSPTPAGNTFMRAFSAKNFLGKEGIGTDSLSMNVFIILGVLGFVIMVALVAGNWMAPMPQRPGAALGRLNFNASRDCYRYISIAPSEPEQFDSEALE